MMKHVFWFVFIVVALQSCYGCGGGSGCCRSTRIQVNCNSGCQPGYGCGNYGCARRRALAGITRRIDGAIVADEEGEQAYTNVAIKGLETDVSTLNVTGDRLVNPNFLFHACCEARGLPDACLRHCHFNTYTADVLERMYRKEDKCPLEAANEIHFCAAQGLDHRQCCAANDVGSTLAGRKCLAFCDQRPNRFVPLDVTYLPCFNIFENMKRCFFTEIRKRAQKKFGSSKLIVRPSSHSQNEDF